MPADAHLSDPANASHRGTPPGGNYLTEAQQVRDAAFWQQWAMRALLVLGGTHALAGIVFFFAYNWDDLSPFAKFGILQAGIVVSFIVALFLRLEKTGGQAMLIAASVMTGVLFAVIGQVYQTGADAWQLFVAWTVLIAPWVFISRSSAHWFLWIVLFITAASLYGAQVLIPLDLVHPLKFSTAIALLPLPFLAAREFAVRYGFNWLDGSWSRRTLVAMAMGPLFILAVSFVFDADSALLGFVAFLIAGGGLAYAYSKIWPDFFTLAMLVALASLVAMAIGGRVIFEMFTFRNPGAFTFALLLLGGWCVLVTTVVVRLLNFLKQQLPEGAHHDQ